MDTLISRPSVGASVARVNSASISPEKTAASGEAWMETFICQAI